MYFDLIKDVDVHLLQTLFHTFNIHGQFLSIIKDNLADRQQRVVLSSAASQWCNITSGVPQGSILGPFLLFMNYLI